MKRLLVLLLLCALLCGCAAAGSAPQAQVSSKPATTQTQATSTGPGVTIPSGTVSKNPGLTVDPYDPQDQIPALTENQIRQDYCDAHGTSEEDVRLRFMGAFEAVYVMFVDVKGMMYAEVITIEEVGGFRFVYSCSQRMQVWHEGEFYSLQLAYDTGLLTQEDLEALSEKYYEAYPYLRHYVALPE